MALSPEVQALRAAVNAQSIEIAQAHTKINQLRATIASQAAQIALQPADLAEIVNQTGNVTANTSSISTDLP